MTTKKQHIANKRNARKSTGPQTVDGKKISSMNSVKHGLYSAPVLAFFEKSKHFTDQTESLVRELVPIGPLEHRTVMHIRRIELKLERSASYERHLLNAALLEDFLRSLGAWGKSAPEAELVELFNAFIQVHRDYDLDIDVQTKIINNDGKLYGQLDSRMKQLQALQSRPLEERSRGAWMEPRLPLTESLAEEAEREAASMIPEDDFGGDARKFVQARIRLMQGRPSRGLANDLQPVDDGSDKPVDEEDLAG